MARITILVAALAASYVAAMKMSENLAKAKMTQALTVTPYNLDGIEHSLLAIAQETVSQPNTSQFIDQIWVLTGQMKSQLLIQMQSIQNGTLDPAWAAYTNCSYSPQSPDALNSSHVACRVDEYTLWVDWNTCDQDCQTGRQTNSVLNQVVQTSTFPLDCSYPRSRDKASGTRAFFEEQQVRFESLLNAVKNARNNSNASNTTTETLCAACSAKQFFLNSKKSQCDSIQRAMEQSACGGGGDPACQNYISCYNSMKSAWMVANATASNVYDSIVTGYRGILRIECLLNGFDNASTPGAASDTLQTEIDRCRATSWHTEAERSLNATFYPTESNPEPAFVSCASSGAILSSDPPNSSAFRSKYYGSLNANTPAGNCTATCC
eukprot:TRINITY_DN8400_c0_g1_i1.p1 TRINITY_DN8400_c0_g1~~TRINITY_DN8400_c0_g1_i1.p1  ORF type:complete len:380 (+),score=47.24 TRINITY_DN8400_c0_g1_i1:65-1204(+)